MKYNYENKKIEFDNSDYKKLELLRDNFSEPVIKRFNENGYLGYYKKLQSDDIWFNIIVQFCVMGSASLIEKVIKNNKKQFLYDTSIEQIMKYKNHKEEYISSILGKANAPYFYDRKIKNYSATRFPNKRAKDIASILSSKNVVMKNKVELLSGLSYKDNKDDIRKKLISRMGKFFKMKSASDFMIGLGLSHDVIALDTRVVGFLNNHLAFKDFTASQIQANPNLYVEIEDSLRQVCNERLKIKLAVLDRVIFRYSSESAINFILEKNAKQ